MATNEILRFAETDTGTNLLTQAEYLADSQRPIGNQPGVARSKLVNKALRQSSLIAAGIAEFLADNQSNNITDSLTPQNIADYMAAVVRSLGIPTAVAGGTADAITADFTPNVALTNGTTVIVRAGAANTTTTPTFAPDGLTAKTIVKGNNLALVAGDIAGAGHWLEMNFDSVLDKWVLQNPFMQVNQTQTIQQFYVSGTYTIPAGVTKLLVQVIGAGGGGGGYGTYGGGSGGGGGATAIKLLTGVTPGNTLTVTIGAGGAGSAGDAAGSSGGTSSVSSGTQTITTISAPGGSGGAGGGAQASTPGQGGVPIGGDVYFYGNDGCPRSFASSYHLGGTGGASFVGGAARQGNSGTIGGGGGGGLTGSASGGNGGNGHVVIRGFA